MAELAGMAGPELASPQDEYPEPIATHDEVVGSLTTFEQALTALWAHLGTRPDKLPRLGGRELDLHLLYRKVTQLGGCLRVIADKRWREVAEPFHFPPTITSVSYNLRRAYTSLLWDFEQVYYFRVSGPRVAPPTSQQAGTAASKADVDGAARQGNGNGACRIIAVPVGVDGGNGEDGGQARKRQRKAVVVAEPGGEYVMPAPAALLATALQPPPRQQQPLLTDGGIKLWNARTYPYVHPVHPTITAPGMLPEAPQPAPAPPPLALTAFAINGSSQPQPYAVGSKGSVNVDGRFDAGCWVTCRLATQEFRGVLYCPPDRHAVWPPTPAATHTNTLRPAAQHAGPAAAGAGGNAAYNGRQQQQQLADPARPNGSLADPLEGMGPGGRNGGDEPGSTSRQQLTAPLVPPRQAKSAFNFFAACTRERLKGVLAGQAPGEVTRQVAELWSRTSEVEKAPYNALASQDRKRFALEQEAYTYRLAAQAVAAKAHQAQHALQVAAAALTQVQVQAAAQAASAVLQAPPGSMAAAAGAGPLSLAAAGPPAGPGRAAGLTALLNSDGGDEFAQLAGAGGAGGGGGGQPWAAQSDQQEPAADGGYYGFGYG